MTIRTVDLSDDDIVILSRKAFDELMEKAGVLPPRPAVDANGTMDAKEALTASIAREIVSRRIKTGMTQTRLAKLSGVRLETISRLELGKHMPQQETVLRLDKALRKAGA